MKSKCQNFCWLSNDNIVQPGALDSAVGILRNYPKIGLVALMTKDVIGPFSDQPYIGALTRPVYPSNIGTQDTSRDPLRRAIAVSAFSTADNSDQFVQHFFADSSNSKSFISHNHCRQLIRSWFNRRPVKS